VKRQTLIWVTAINFAVAGAACSNSRANEAAKPINDSAGDVRTISGCLSAGQDGQFALTAAPDAAVSTIAQGTGLDRDRDTNAYVLIGGDNLQSHVGKRVEVTGTLQGHKQDVEQHDSKKTESAPAAGGNDTPTVKTKESVDLEVRQLNVRSVRDVAPTCSVTP